MNAHTTDLAMVLYIVSLSCLFLAVLVTWARADHRAGVATHHCHPGTCPLCDTMGCWQA